MSVPTIRSAARTDVGRARDRNEDSFFVGKRVFAVADGLGGHNAGDVASKLAIEPIASLDGTLSSSRDTGAEELTEAVLDANRAVFARAQADDKVRGMGTTLTAVVISDGAAQLAHVGDSRCYLLRGGAISQLSSDHTLVARMVAEGKLTPEQAESHPQRSIVTRALGAEPEVDIDTLEVPLLPGDRLLLCSDGLSSVVGEENIRSTLAGSTDLDDACRKLVDEANSNGGPDNITVVLVEVTGGGADRAGDQEAADLAARAGERMEARERRRAARRLPVRAIIWTLVVVIVLLGGWLAARSWINRSYFVGVADSQVAIYQGLPTEVGGVHLNHVVERTGIPVTEVREDFRPRLDEGIRTKNLGEARDVVARVPRGSGPAPNPTASPSPTPTST